VPDGWCSAHIHGRARAVPDGILRVGYPVLAILVVLFVGSNPFQLHHAYAWDNIFSFPISITMLVMALHAGVISRGADRLTPLVAAVTGVVVGCAREVRTEAALVGVAVPIVYLALSGPWRPKVALVGVFILSVIATGQFWRIAFERAFRSAQTFVSRAGGHPYPSSRERGRRGPPQRAGRQDALRPLRDGSALQLEENRATERQVHVEPGTELAGTVRALECPPRAVPPVADRLDDVPVAIVTAANLPALLGLRDGRTSHAEDTCERRISSDDVRHGSTSGLHFMLQSKRGDARRT
jgi:hypothetical protein